MPVSSVMPMLYHAHHSRHLEDYPFWSDLAVRHGDPILELGCGTGRIALPLAHLGYRVYGLDQDLAMLTFLRLRTHADAFPVFQADMAAFHLGIKFPLIFLPCNTMSILSGPTRQAMLMCVGRHLTKGGLFAVSLPNPLFLAELPPRGDLEYEETFPHPIDGAPVRVSSEWRHTSQRFTITWHYDHIRKDGQRDHLTARARHIVLPVEAYLAEFKRAGLRVMAMFGDFDRRAFHPSSPTWIILAQLA